MKNTNICVVGLGNIGLLHLEILCGLGRDGIKVYGVESDVKKSLMIKEKYNVEIFNDIHKAINELEFDLVDICLPTFKHFDAAQLIIKNTRANILIEKPITRTLDEAEKLADLMNLPENKDRFVMCAMVERFFSPFQEIKKWLDTQQSPFKMEFTRRTKRQAVNSWLLDKKLGGGVMFDLGIHDIDLMQWFTGEDIEEIVRVNKSELDAFDVEIKTSKGSFVQFKFGWDVPEDSSIGIINKVSISSDNEISYNSDLNQLLINGSLVNEFEEGRCPSAYRAEIEHAINCTINNEKPRIDLSESLKVMETIERIKLKLEDCKE
ncbi:Gfo/Idh/MocA family oxidoreductase [Clostridium subterminale]|uniref:Gfo/Idh/MocA family oxidoreductase n=1 Tax=Clostridium subterminale TaxID=1550 RepID=A0ABN1KP41_CLOSU